MTGLFILGVVAFAAIFANVVAPYDPVAMQPADRLQPPSWHHLFGTDELGRDLFSRIVYGARTSLTVATIAVAVGSAVGTTFGLVAGFRGGLVDTVVMRTMDGIMAFPGLILAIGIVAVRGPGLTNVTIALSLFAIPVVSRLVRAQVLMIRELTYVEAARAAGASDLYLMARVIVPGCLSPLLVYMSLAFSGAILAEAALAFLGLGARPPTPSWGEMLNSGRTYLADAPWYAIAPGAVIFIAVLALNLVGDGLRDALDPRLQQEGGR